MNFSIAVMSPIPSMFSFLFFLIRYLKKLTVTKNHPQECLEFWNIHLLIILSQCQKHY